VDPDPDLDLRIHASALTNGSGSDPDSAIFVIDLQPFFKNLFCLLLFEGTFSSFSVFRYKVKKSHKAVGIKVFFTIFAW
jgi:hypothetical protein